MIYVPYAINLLNPCFMHSRIARPLEMYCKSIRKVQKIIQLNILFLDLWKILIDRLNQRELAQVALTAYYLWARINAYIHTSKFEHPNAIILKTANDLNLVWSQVLQIPHISVYFIIISLMIDGKNLQQSFLKSIEMQLMMLPKTRQE